MKLNNNLITNLINYDHVNSANRKKPMAILSKKFYSQLFPLLLISFVFNNSVHNSFNSLRSHYYYLLEVLLVCQINSDWFIQSNYGAIACPLRSWTLTTVDNQGCSLGVPVNWPGDVLMVGFIYLFLFIYSTFLCFHWFNFFYVRSTSYS